MGRPSEYTPEIGDKIASLLAEDRSYEEIAASCKINRQTIYNWLEKQEDLSAKCVRARSQQSLSIEAQIVEIQRELRNGEIAPDAARVLINSLQWRAKVTNPRVYGDKTTISGDPDNPIGGLALRLDTAINHRNQIIDVTPQLIAPDDGSDLV